MKKNINQYNEIIIKIDGKHEGKSVKELLIKDGIDALLYNGDKKEIEIIKGKFVDQSNGEPMTN